jgi:hypothetical protein
MMAETSWPPTDAPTVLSVANASQDGPNDPAPTCCPSKKYSTLPWQLGDRW